MSDQKSSSDYSLEIYKVEYEKLKAEQTQRIQFRDNLLMAHLTVVGAVIGFIVANAANPLIAYAYLIIPWTSGILGWTYLNNDILISNIRDYLRGKLSNLLKDNLAVKEPFCWEHDIGNRALWKVRKRVQTFMDAATFSVPAFGALVRLWYVAQPVGHRIFPWLIGVDVLITLLLLVGLIYWNVIEIGQKGVSSQETLPDETSAQTPAALSSPAKLELSAPASQVTSQTKAKQEISRGKH